MERIDSQRYLSHLGPLAVVNVKDPVPNLTSGLVTILIPVTRAKAQENSGGSGTTGMMETTGATTPAGSSDPTPTTTQASSPSEGMTTPPATTRAPSATTQASTTRPNTPSMGPSSTTTNTSGGTTDSSDTQTTNAPFIPWDQFFRPNNTRPTKPKLQVKWVPLGLVVFNKLNTFNKLLNNKNRPNPSQQTDLNGIPPPVQNSDPSRRWG
ncbi:unnamed protein product [Allacma fusca]|uniref:Uncharacterized protein n=1 Tax=Allacma fusca TaxID=39272 RepID=A0A8J2L471_9HEXA|nr:unnamed protein product [Allacma fusca]